MRGRRGKPPRERPAGFRLLTEPASLKHRRHLDPDAVGCVRFPAPHRAGLIEACAWDSRSQQPPRVFPAPHRAGLIEALLLLISRFKIPGCFRLLTEPASLKPRRGPRDSRARRAFPAPHRAGLIEAHRRMRRRPRRDRGFRLLTEPASLKLALRASDLSAVIGFRLLTEPASLKLQGPDSERTLRVRFRLLTEPASLKRPGCRGGAPATPAFPAPHRAGLIEAGGRAPPLRSHGSPCFRLLTEPASLKLNPFSTKISLFFEFPAPHRAGLIEASPFHLG